MAVILSEAKDLHFLGFPNLQILRNARDNDEDAPVGASSFAFKHMV